MRIRAYITHKLKENFSDCQDRFSINPDTKSVAVADGMSQSIFQKIWANLLTNQYVRHKEWVPNEPNTIELSYLWFKEVEKNLEEQKQRGIDPFRAENRIAEGKGACATLVGLRFDDHKWTCDVLGDSSLIEINASTGEICNIYSSQEGEYDNYPDYFDSVNGKLYGKLRAFSGELAKGTILLLVSDPFTEYINRFKQNGEPFPIKKMLEVASHEQYEAYVDALRKEGMHNDDSTLVIIEYDGDDKFNVEYEDNLDEMIRSERESRNKNEESKNVEKVEAEQEEKVFKPTIMENNDAEANTESQQPVLPNSNSSELLFPHNQTTPIAQNELSVEGVLYGFLKYIKEKERLNKNIISKIKGIIKKGIITPYIEEEIKNYIKEKNK